MSDINNVIASHTLSEIKEYIMENNFQDVKIKGITLSNISKIFEAMGTDESMADIKSKTSNIQNQFTDLTHIKNSIENKIKKYQTALGKIEDFLSTANDLSTEIKNTPGFIKTLEYLTYQTQKIIEQQKQFQVLLEYINNDELSQ